MGTNTDSPGGNGREAESSLPEAPDAGDLARLLGLFPVPAWIADEAEGRFLRANEAAARALGYRVEELAGRRIDELRVEDPSFSVYEQLERLISGPRREGRTYLRAQDGTVKPFQLSVTPVIFQGRTALLTVTREQDQQADWERLLTAFFNSAAEGVVLTGPDRVIRMVNRSFADMLGYEPQELMEQHASAVALAQDHAAAEEHWASRAAGEPLQFDAPLRHKDGHAVWVFGSTRPLFDLNGELAGALSVVTDVTARKRETDRHAALAAIVDSSLDAIIGITPAGRITSWNAGAERLYGYTESEAVGRSRDMIVPDDRRDEAAEFLQKVVQGEDIGPVESVRRRKDGTLVHVSISAFAVRGPQGEITGAATIARDITDSRHAEARLRNVEQRLLQSQKLDSLAMLAGGIAHDFNNLLVGMLGNAELALGSTEPGTELHTIAGEILESATRAAELSRQMLAYSGRSRFSVRRVDLSEAVRGMEDLLRTAAGRSATMEFDLSDGLPPVDVDPEEVGQVLLNLVRNADEATPGHGTIRVWTGRVNATRTFLDDAYVAHEMPEGVYVGLMVEDTGSGIPEDVRGRIFEPFFSTKFTGRGLGLAATVGIVRGHRGCIHVASQPDKGSRFTVLLPPAR